MKNKYLIFIIYSLIFNLGINLKANSQKKNKAIVLTKKDNEKIEYALKENLNSYIMLLNNITDPDNTLDDKKIAIDGKLNIIFTGKEATIEDDIESKSNKIPIDQYLDEACNTIKSKDIPFDFKQNLELLFYQSNIDKSLIAITSFHQKWNAKNENKENLKSNDKKIIYIIDNSDNKNFWNVKIADISIEGKNSFDLSNFTRINITENNTLDIDEKANDDFYCKARLNQGHAYLLNKQFAKAYYSLMDARKCGEIKNQVDDEIVELKKAIKKIINENENETWDSYLYLELKKIGEYYITKYNYETASNYFSLASNVNFSKSKNDIKFQNESKLNSEKVNYLKSIESLYLSDKYNEAINEYEKAFSNDPNNSFISANIAKCYAQLYGKTNLAKKYFNISKNIDPENSFIYKVESDFYYAKNKYDSAIYACLNYLKYVELKDPEIVIIQSTSALCYANKLKSKNIDEALDSCNQAINYYSKNTNAYIFKSQLIVDSKADKDNKVNNAIAVIDNAISISGGNNKSLSLAYLKKSELLLLNKNDDKKNNKNINNIVDQLLKKSIDYDKQNLNAYYSRGDFYLKLSKEITMNDNVKFNENLKTAIELLNTVAINTDEEILIRNAKLKKSECYLLTYDFANADKELESISSTMPSNNTIYLLLQGLTKLKTQPKSSILYFNKVTNQNNPELKYAKLLYDLVNNPNNIKSLKIDLVFEIFNNLPPFYVSKKIETDFISYGLESCLSDLSIKKALKNLNK